MRLRLVGAGQFCAAAAARIRPVYEVLRTAGAVEPEVREVFAETERHRLAHMRQLAGWFAGAGRCA